jgi:hypothetical protein
MELGGLEVILSQAAAVTRVSTSSHSEPFEPAQGRLREESDGLPFPLRC